VNLFRVSVFIFRWPLHATITMNLRSWMIIRVVVKDSTNVLIQPLAAIRNKPLIDWLIEWLSSGTAEGQRGPVAAAVVSGHLDGDLSSRRLTAVHTVNFCTSLSHPFPLSLPPHIPRTIQATVSTFDIYDYVTHYCWLVCKARSLPRSHNESESAPQLPRNAADFAYR